MNQFFQTDRNRSSNDDQPRQKRHWLPWYELPVRPTCPDCQIPCITKHTSKGKDGQRVQHRYCPHCGKPFKTTYRLEDLE